jgi:division protein CdvB (Snf7/Vps24/ESCRT-III family)
MAKEADIKKFMAQKISEGLALAEIQKLIEEKFQKRMTFLDVRLMASTLDSIDWEKEAEKESAAEEAEEAKEEAAKEADENCVETDAAAGDGKCVVELSKLVKPGAVAHGSVKFPSGASGNWVLDQMGRLGMENAEGEPTEEDLKAFQEELQKLFARG